MFFEFVRRFFLRRRIRRTFDGYDKVLDNLFKSAEADLAEVEEKE